MSATVYDDRVCALGEGPLWHPERGQLFWFDITGQRLLSRDETGPLEWHLPEFASAAGWIDADTLMIVTASGFHQFDIATGKLSLLAKLEAEDNHTRSNDGRTDPVGGFWVGTMGLGAEPGRGAIYRYFRGEVRKLFDGISIPNAICFSPDNSTAYFTDTAQGIVWKQYIDRAGWPSGRREALIDFGTVGLNPDGAVCDANGDLWIAQWGASRVACHGPDGRFKSEIRTGAIHTTCPAFGGPEMQQMFITSATFGLDAPTEGAGQTWIAEAETSGQREHRFIP